MYRVLKDKSFEKSLIVVGKLPSFFLYFIAVIFIYLRCKSCIVHRSNRKLFVGLFQVQCVTLADSSRFSEFVGNVPNVPTTIFAGKTLIEYSPFLPFPYTYG